MTHHPGFGRPYRDLASGLSDSAHWIWDRRRVAKARGFPFSEETVTETVLLDLAAALGRVVHIVPFNKHEEGKLGADWEWCLYDAPANRYLRFLIQAKVLDDQDKRYAHIDRCIGNTGVRQIDRLADTARRRGIPALYAFYNNLTDTTRVPDDRCPCHECLECWGASIAPLDAVRAALPDKTFDTLRDVSIPWLCLLCTANGNGSAPDPIDGAIAGLRRLAGLSRDRFPDAFRDDCPPPLEDPEQEPPSYLEPIIAFEAERLPHDGRHYVIEKLARENPDLDGVVLIDASDTRAEWDWRD